MYVMLTLFPTAAFATLDNSIGTTTRTTDEKTADPFSDVKRIRLVL